MEKIKGLTIIETKQVAFAHWCISKNKVIDENANFVDLFSQFENETDYVHSFIQSMNIKMNGISTKKKTKSENSNTTSVSTIEETKHTSSIVRRRTKKIENINVNNNVDTNNENNHINELVQEVDNIHVQENETPTFVMDTSKLNGQEIHMQTLVHNVIHNKLPNVSNLEILFVDLVYINGVEYYKDDKGTYYNVKNMDVDVPLFLVENEVNVSTPVEKKQMKKSHFFIKKTSA